MGLGETVLKRPRNIDYDQGSHALSIGLYEKELPQDIKVSSTAFEPEQVAILPDTTLQWQYLIPVWIKKIMRPIQAPSGLNLPINGKKCC